MDAGCILNTFKGYDEHTPVKERRRKRKKERKAHTTKPNELGSTVSHAQQKG